MTNKITIFGLGALGSNLLVQLVRQFPDYSFVGVDFDKIEERNIRTQAYFVEHVGQLKAQAIRAVAQRYVRKLAYLPVVQKIVEPRVPNSEDFLWVDCFDNTQSRLLLTPNLRFCADHPILHVGFSPFYTAECMWNKDYDVPGDVDPTQNDICSMSDAVSFIGFIVNLTALTISEYVQNNRKRNFIVTNKSTVRYI